MNTAPVLPIAQFTAKQTNSTAHLEKTKMAANYPTNVSKKREDLMESFVHSIAQKNVPKANCSVLEVLMKQDAWDLAVAEIKKNTDGDPELKPNLNLNAPDIVQLNV